MECKCGCGKELIAKAFHKYYGTPKYIMYHNLRNHKSSQKQRDAISKGRMGMTFSLEHRQNLSKSHIGILAGKNHPQWKGGKSRGYKSEYSTTKYKNWRISVFERDNYTCQKCKLRSKKDKPVYLEAHHIKQFAFYPELRFDVNNGQTLCRECHRKTKHYRILNKRKIAC